MSKKNREYFQKTEQKMEKFLMMVINAIGMMESKNVELTQRMKNLEDWSNEMVETLKSYSKYLMDLSKRLDTQEEFLIKPAPKILTTKSIGPEFKEVESLETVQPTSNLLEGKKIASIAPDEDEIANFQKQLLTPIPKDIIKKQAEPTSIRAALIREMKEFFGSASKKDKDKDI